MSILFSIYHAPITPFCYCFIILLALLISIIITIIIINYKFLFFSRLIELYLVIIHMLNDFVKIKEDLFYEKIFM